MEQLQRCDANYVPLTPLTFLKRASMAYSNRTSIIHGQMQFTWRQTYERCRRLASAIKEFKIQKNDVVSVLAPNIPAMYEMHFAVPMTGAVLNAINTRLDAKTVATILCHSEAKILFVDYQFVPLAGEALRVLKMATNGPVSLPLIVVIDDINTPTGTGALEYEQLVSSGNPMYEPEEIADEWEPIALNYTSGTTSKPKGVVYSHRGAYLSTLSMLLGWEMKTESVYLWTLPMFHCNGWTFTWGVAARGGTNVCIRETNAAEIYRSIAAHNVTHMCCVPIVLNMLLDAKEQDRRPVTSLVEIMTGGAPPPAALLQKIESLGFHVVHAYGMTEATGPALVCEWQEKWSSLPGDDQARLKARQGIGILGLADVDVKNPETMESVPRDGMTMGEIVIRGSTIMKGYLKDEDGTVKAFRNGWFMTGDVGVIHPDGYLEIKDRSKDVIISGGENISSLEVESVLYKHPEVVEAAVVAMPHTKWGESPCAFVMSRKTASATTSVTESEIIQHCRRNLPHFMVPKKVQFMSELPKTSTGKIQKFQLRTLAKTFASAKPEDENYSAHKNWKNTVHGQHQQNQEQIHSLSRL